MNVVLKLSTWPALRWPWALLGLSALAFELTALYFQYFLGLEPCIMCVYQRVAVLGILLACVPGAINPKNIIMRTASFIALFVSSVWGFLIAYEHVQMQNPDNFMLLMTCDIFPNFPSWMPLHEWIPSVFEPRGTCGDIDWQFLTLSMPEWMVVVFAGYIAIGLTVLAASLIKNKSL